MKKTTLQTIGLLGGLAAIVAAAPRLWTIQLPGATQVDGGLPVGASMPAIDGSGWINGPGPSIDDVQGKVVVVHAWSLGCPHCTKQMPELVALHEQCVGKDVVFVGMTGDRPEHRQALARHLAELNVTWPNVYAARESMQAFDVKAIPRYWVIDRQGIVVWNRATKGQTMAEAIEAALAARW